MSYNIFTPGPTPNTVRAAGGKVLIVLDGWALLPPGDAALTRRVKAAGDHWVVQEEKGRKIFPEACGHRQRPSSGFRPTSKPSDPPRASPSAKRPMPNEGKRPKSFTSKTSPVPS